jgi:FkbM family methyltransferase
LSLAHTHSDDKSSDKLSDYYSDILSEFEAELTGPSEREHGRGERVRVRLAKLTQPSKLLDSLRVRRFRRAFGKLPIDPGWDVVYLGTQYGGWAVPDGVIDGDWVCYCVGAGGDISFELELMDRYGCEVVSFDPAEEAETLALRAAAGRPRFTFMQVGIADHDGTMRMWKASDPDHMALSSTNLQRTDETVAVPVRSLPSVMTELGHERIDLLKLALEGYEYELVPRLDLKALGVRVLDIELNQLVAPRRAAALVEHIRAQGYVPVFRHPGGPHARTTLAFAHRDLVGRRG